MRAGRLIAWSAGAALTAAWIAAAATVVQPVPPSSAPRPVERPAESVPALAEESRRVRDYAAVAPAPRRPGRNPFVFGSSREPDQPRLEVSPAASAPEGTPAGVEPREVIIVIGIATERAASGDPKLTAIISVDDRMRFVTVGDALGPDLEVVQIEPDGITVRDTVSGARQRVVLP